MRATHGGGNQRCWYGLLRPAGGRVPKEKKRKNQNDGNWKVNCRMIRSIRGETAAIKATIRRHAEAWFPRAENTRADLLSKLALTGQEVTEAGWVAELDELLHDFENEPNE